MFLMTNYYKKDTMQKIIYGLLFISILSASCSSAKKDNQGDLNDKKATLESLKIKQKDIAAQIANLEGEISQLDTSAAAKKENEKLVAITPIGTDTFSHFIELQGRVDAENISY